MRADESLQPMLEGGASQPDTPAARAFSDGFAAMLERFGYTTNNGLQDLANWREGSPVPLAMIRAYATQDESKSPVAISDRQAQRRAELEAEVHSSQAAGADAADLALMMEMAQQLIPNLEDHNLMCDQRLVSASRARWLAIGAYLQGQGKTGLADDVFFYKRAELVEALEGGSGLSSEEIAKRRALQEQYRAKLPPLYLGLEPEEYTSKADIPAEGDIRQSVKGIAASPGSLSRQGKGCPVS